MRELSWRAIILGILLAVILSAANSYLGLKAGMTVAASIPAAVVSMIVLTKILKDGTILENNMVQTMASVAQAVAAGIIFTVPSFFILKHYGVIDFLPSYWFIFILCFIGSLWGVVFMIIFRKPHIVDEHDSLPYPEGTACAQVLKTGQKATENAKYLLFGFIISAVFKILQNIKFKIGGVVYRILDETFSFSLSSFKNFPVSLQKLTISMDLLPALLGVGIIVGLRIGIMMATGALIAWWVIIPTIGMFQPSLTAQEIYKGYIRYIGIGVIITGAIFSFFQFFPVILKVILNTGKSENSRVYKNDPHKDLWYDNPNYDRDLPYFIALILVILGGIIFFWINPIPSLLGKFLSFLVLVIFSILFTAVSSYIVGMVGSSNQPVSAMTISTLIAVALTLKLIGLTGETGIIAVIVLSVIACISLAIAGDMSQDLKTGFLVKATPYNQQIVGMISAIVSSFFLSYLIFVLNDVYGFVGGALPAPQANLIATLAQSIFQGDIKWNEIFIGIFLGLIARLLGFSVLAFGVGVYLPLGLSLPILLGGFISSIIKNDNEEKKVLTASGLIAGDTILGIIFVFLIASNLLPIESEESIFFGFSGFLSIILFFVLIFIVYRKIVLK